MPKTKLKAKSKRKTGNDNPNTDAFIKTQIFSVCMYCAVFLLSSAIALAADSRDKYDYYISLLSFAAASFATGFFAGNKLRKNGLAVGVLYSLPINIIVVLISLIINGFIPTVYLAITALALLAASAVGGVLAVNKRHRR